MSALNFQLVTPERTVLKQELSSLTCPTPLGEITILPHHAALVANLVPGEVKAKDLAGKESFIFVSGGFVEVRENGEVVILADAAEHNFEIDISEAEEAKKRAEKAMSEKKIGDEDYARVAASLQQSLARVSVARKHARKSTNAVGDSTFSNF